MLAIFTPVKLVNITYGFEANRVWLLIKIIQILQTTTRFGV